MSIVYFTGMMAFKFHNSVNKLTVKDAGQAKVATL